MPKAARSRRLPWRCASSTESPRRSARRAKHDKIRGVARLGSSFPRAERGGGGGRRSGMLPTAAVDEKKKKIRWSAASAAAKLLAQHHRKRHALGLVLMIISQGAGFVLPAGSKFLIDEVIGKGNVDMVWPVAL